MKKVSKSPDRHSFQKTGYIKRMADEGKIPNEAYLDFFDKILNEHENKFEDPKSRINNLEYDLLTTNWILDKVRNSENYAQNLYAAMCNMRWCKRDLWPILKEEYYSCTWRYAGGIIADMRQEGDYIDWYCSGMGGLSGEWNKDSETFEQWQSRTKYVGEGFVTEEIEEDLHKLGWMAVPYDEDDK